MPKVWFKRICALYQGFIVAACAFEFLAGQKWVRARAAPNHRLGVTEGCGCITLFNPFG